MFFFFKQKTAYEMRISDWSSDVCSSDLRLAVEVAGVALGVVAAGHAVEQRPRAPVVEHAEDAHRRAAHLQLAADAVRAAEQLLVEVGGNHRNACALIAVLRPPGAAVAEPHYAPRDKVRVRRQHPAHR